MANYASLKAAIQDVIKTNGNNEITGSLLQQSLLAMINSLGAGYQFVGVAQPSTNPGTPDQNVFYIGGPGTYNNFNNTTVNDGEIGVFKYNGSWVVETLPVGSSGLVLGTPTQDANKWSFDFKFEANKTYYVKAFNHNNDILAVGSQNLERVQIGKWVEMNPTQTGYPYIFFGSGSAGAAPILVFSDMNGALRDSLSQDSKIVDIDSALANIQTQLNEKVDGTGITWDVAKTIHVTQGTANTSRNNLLNGVNIPAGTVLKIKLRGTTGVISKVQLVNQNYSNLYNRAYTDGDLITITLANTLTSMGLYIEAAVAIGTGNIDVYVCTDYKQTIGGRIDGLEQKTTQQGNDIVLLQDFAQTGFLYDKRVVIPVTQGADIHSKTNLLNGVNIPAGTTLKVKLTGTTGVISKVQLVNQNYAFLYNGTYTDGQIITIELANALTSMGFYADAVAAIGTGNVTVDICTNYDDSLSGRIDEIASKTDTTTVITCKPTGTSGVDADFCGLTAIADAINSISDASPSNKYAIHVIGTFKFTDPLTVPMLAGGEYSIIAMKDYVDIIGDGMDKSAIILDIPANATFHSGKTYSDYQPIYFYGTGGRLYGLGIYGKNCRYALHIETAAGAQNKEIEIENCDIRFGGSPDYGGSATDCVGTGLTSGQKWHFKNCRMAGSNAFACHTPLQQFDNAPIVTFENCMFYGGITLHSYQVENNSFFNIIDCAQISRVTELRIQYYPGGDFARHANYARVLPNGINFKCLFRPLGFNTGEDTPLLRGAAVRVVSSSVGQSSIVSFDTTASAYPLIIGDPTDNYMSPTIYNWAQQSGYVYRNGGANISGQAFGTIDCADNAGHANATLGKRLGNCSVTNKVLGIYVDGTLYNVTFNRDYTNVANDDIIAEINAVLGAAAVADLFSPAKLYYPNVNGLSVVVCADENSILKGMGVVFTYNGMRRAKNSDGYIDGICIDDTANGQTGRVIRRGAIYTNRMATAAYYHHIFCALDNLTTAAVVPGAMAGISTTNDGVFDINATPKLLRAYNPTQYETAWKIIE